MDVKKIVFFAGLFLLPFVFWPQAPIPYEMPRVFFFQRWVELLLIVGLFSLKNLKKRKVDSFLVILILLFLGTCFLSSLLGVNFAKSISGNAYRQDGLVTLVHLVAVSFFLALFWEKDWEKSFIKTVSISAILVAILSIVSKVFFHNSAFTFGNPNFLAGYLVVTLPFLWQWKKFMTVSLILSGVVILTTGSLGGIVAMAFFFLGIFMIQKNIERKKIISIFLFLVVLIFLGSFIVVQQYHGWQPEGRDRIIVRGVLSFLQRPLLGFGWANFDYAFNSVNWPIKVVHDVYVDKAHSMLLEVLTTTGITGFILYISIITRVIKRFIIDNKIPTYFFLSFLLFLIHSQTNVISISEEIFFWIILGMLYSK